MKEASIYSNQSLIAYNQAAKIRQPRKGTFDFPSFPVALEFSAILRFRFSPITSMRNNQIYFKLFKLVIKLITVIALINNKAQGALSGTTTTIARYTHRFKGFFGELGMSMSELSRSLELSMAGISQSVKRGEKIAVIQFIQGVLDLGWRLPT